MSEVLGTIKILEDRIITKKGETTEVWIKHRILGKNYIKYNGYFYTIDSEIDYKSSIEDNTNDSDDIDWDDVF